MITTEIIVGKYEDLKTECNLIRYEVFVQEQNVPENIEIDERDEVCTHLILRINNNPIGTGRIDLEKQGKIGRLAIVKEFRNKGYGTLILNKLEEIARQNNLTSVWLNAQKASLNFYLKLGYQIISDEFIEANIIHLTMSKKL